MMKLSVLVVYKHFNKLIQLTVFTVALILNTLVLAENRMIAIPKDPPATGSDPSTVVQLNTNEVLKSRSSMFSPKIVGGTTSRRGEFPEFVQLFVEGNAIGLDPRFVYSWCGGSLITSNKVLTAAHCTEGIGASNFYALPNFYSFNDSFSFFDLIPITVKREHPQFEQGTQFNHDVAVITMQRSSGTSKAKLVVGNNPLSDFDATVIGTGVLSEGGAAPLTLQKVTVPIVDNAVCRGPYGVSAITDNMLCAGFTSGGRDSCQGDSGGPLWVNHEGERGQAGIVSWGNGCARPNFYGVYARTSALIDFILQHAPQTQVVEINIENVNIIPTLDLLLLNDTAFVPKPLDPRIHCRRSTPDKCPDDGETDYLYTFSQSGDWVGQGKTRLLRRSNGGYYALDSFLNGALLVIEAPGVNQSYHLTVMPPNNGSFQVDNYTDTISNQNPNSDHPTLKFRGNGRSCDSTGEFEVFEVGHDAAGRLVKLALNFRQQCNNSSASLYGYLRFNSILPMQP